MRILFFILLFPAISFANTYNYGKIISLNKGSDNFGFDKMQTVDNSGEIRFDDNAVFIDGKKFELKKSETANRFKSKNCSIEFLYKENELAAVKMYRYNKVVCYIIQNDQPLVTKK